MEGRPRVAVTGIGVVAPCGIGKDAFWDGLLGPGPRGSGVACRRLGPEPWFDNPKEARRADRFAQFASAAATEALADAGEPAGRPEPSGRRSSPPASVASHTLEEQIQVVSTEGRAAGLAVPRADDDGERGAARRSRCATAGRGRCETSCTACAASTHAIGNAARLIA